MVDVGNGGVFAFAEVLFRCLCNSFLGTMLDATPEFLIPKSLQLPRSARIIPVLLTAN